MKISVNRNIFILLSILVLIVFSCRVSEEILPNQRKLNDKEAQEVLFSKDSIPFWFFYSKIGFDFKDSKRSDSFKTTVKMRVDSAFSGTLSFAAIIGATYLVTKDSVYFAHKIDKCFIKEDFSSLSEIFGTSIEFSFFQSLILGLPVGLDRSIKYNQKHTRDYYVLSSFKKKDLRKIDDDEADNIFVQYYLNTETLHLDKISIQVPSDTVTIDIAYKNRQLSDDYYFPSQTEIKIVHPRDSIFINLDYGSIKLNDRKEIDINIPDSYVKCE